MKKYFFVIFTLVFLLFSVASLSAQTVSGSLGPIKRGGSARGKIVLSIPSGLHVNSNRPENEFAIPTRVRIFAKGVKLSAVNYPRGTTRNFEFTNKPISVYEGQTSFGFTVFVPERFRGENISIRAAVRFQACTDEVCYPPKTVEITLSAKIK